MSGDPSPSPQPVARPLRRDAERNRQRILTAASDLFAAHGLAVTMDEIAERAGVGVGTVYRRFQSRELLIEALFEDRIGEIVALAERALAQPDAWESLAAFAERAVELQAADLGLKQLVLGTAHGQDRVARSLGRIMPLVDALVRRAQDAGRLREDVSAADIAAVFAMLGAIAESSHGIEPRLWRRYLALLLDGLRPRRASASPLPVAALDDRQLFELCGWTPAG